LLNTEVGKEIKIGFPEAELHFIQMKSTLPFSRPSFIQTAESPKFKTIFIT